MNRSTLLIAAVLVATGRISSAHTWNASPHPGDLEKLRSHILEEWEAGSQHGGSHSESAAAPVLVASGAPSLQLAAAAIADIKNAPVTAEAFLSFPKLSLKWDKDFLYVGSNGWPDHNMMVGITAWQQQVPLPQAYFGDNAWRVPLNPVPASAPVMIKGRFLRGAIALAANGIPIFNPQNNRGEVSQEIGELDQWGGHCGRADDYHYHVVSLHLQAAVGKGKPVAYALDGYPIYGLTESDGSPVGTLDECHGHEMEGIGYHYHASMKYPYVIGGFHGQVVEADGQVDPQPRAQPVRESLRAVRGASITGFENTGKNSYKLSYVVNGDPRSVSYSINADGTYPFAFDNGREGKTSESYTRRDRPEGKGPGEGGKGGRGGPGQRKVREAETPVPGTQDSPSRAPGLSASAMDLNGDGFISAVEFAEEAKRQFALHHEGGTLGEALAKARSKFQQLDRNRDGQIDRDELALLAANDVPPPPPRGEEPPRREDGPRGRKGDAFVPSPDQPRSSNGSFILSSPVVEDLQEMPADFTGEGSAATLPLEWKGAPAGTQGFALIMDHADPQGLKKWYWTVYDIPAAVASMPKNAQGIGKVGTGFKGRVGYEPPHSKGPGPKTYVLTIYALSAPLHITQMPAQVNRDVLLAAMQGKVLATSSLRVVHTSNGAESQAPGDEQRPPRREDQPRADRRPPQAQPPSVEPNNTPPPAGAGERKGGPDNKGLIKPTLADTVHVDVYADNWFAMFINGELVAVDSIKFTPHNVQSFDILPEYPMTIAVITKDNADPKTGMEYGDHVGDGGFIVKFSDGTVSSSKWKAMSFFKGPLNHDTKNPAVVHTPIPEGWWKQRFDDSKWPFATEFTEERVDPKEPFYKLDFSGAKWIWSEDLDLDNTVILRTTIEKPGWRPRWNTRPDIDISGAPFK